MSILICSSWNSSLNIPIGWERDWFQCHLVTYLKHSEVPLRSLPASTFLVRKLFIQDIKKKKVIKFNAFPFQFGFHLKRKTASKGRSTWSRVVESQLAENYLNSYPSCHPLELAHQQPQVACQKSNSEEQRIKLQVPTKQSQFFSAPLGSPLAHRAPLRTQLLYLSSAW